MNENAETQDGVVIKVTGPDGVVKSEQVVVKPDTVPPPAAPAR